MSIIVLIGGGHASGKTTAANLLKQELLELRPSLNIDLVDMNQYTVSGSTDDTIYSSMSSVITINTTIHRPLKPSRFDFDKLKQYMVNSDSDLIIVHGLYALYDREIRDMAKLKVFINGDADTRLIRWIRRDVMDNDNEINLEMVLSRYLQGARAEMNDFINPTKEFSDVIMPTGPENIGIELLVDGIMPYIARDPRTTHFKRFYEEETSFYELS